VPTLAIIPALPVYLTASGQALLTKKFVEGMSQYATLWNGRLISVMAPAAAPSTGNLDDEIFELDQLPFELRCVPFSGKGIYSALADADAIMLGSDHRLAGLAQWCREQGKKLVFLTEYSLQTRLQIINAEVRNPIVRWRKYLWEWQHEQRIRRNIAIADAVQCNGTPTYNAYQQLNTNALLFFDSRVTPNMLADPKVVAERQTCMQNSPHIRLAYSGRLIAMKGADDLIEVARHLDQLGVAFSLDIYGEGKLRPVMEEQIREYNLTQQVQLHGVLDFTTELLPLIRNTVDLFICCHRQGDPSCTYLETFACGIPIVGYANEALCGLTKENPLGWTTSLNEPEKLAQRIKDLSTHREQLCAAGNAALEFANQHTFEKEFSARIAQVKNLTHTTKILPPICTETLKLPLRELTSERLHNFQRRKHSEKLRANALSKAFSETTSQRLLLVSQSERIPQSQIFPFHFFADDLERAYDVSIRETPLEPLLEGRNRMLGDATVIAFQMPYDISNADLERLLNSLRRGNPDARLIHFDWSAPADLRNAERLDPHIDLYVKKHVLRNRSLYGKSTLGDTNLSDHYAQRLSVTEQEHCFPIPAGFMQKLIVGPSFITAPLLLPALMQPFQPGPERCIDLHARFAVNGTPWYQAMRNEAEAALGQFSDLKLATGNALPLYKYIAELRRAKVCFSPFGYGEVCWRDYEAIMAGAVLLKPDMSHIETFPDIFRPWETYVPLRWDLTDFGETLRRLLNDTALRKSITVNAHSVLNDYLTSDGFVTQIKPVFSGHTP